MAKCLRMPLVTMVLFLVFSSFMGPGRTSAGQPYTQARLALALRFRLMDTNRDGVVSREEFRGPRERFDMLDSNADGVITMEELNEAARKRGQATPAPQPKASPPATKTSAGRSTVKFGLCTTPREFERDKNEIKELGFVAVRSPMPWQYVEPSEGQFQWNQLDTIIGTLQSQGIEVILVIRSISKWGIKTEAKKTGVYYSSAMPRDIRQWERFVEALASRYRGRGVHYEIENEVSAPAFWQGTKEEYAELLKISYQTIKRVDPKATVLAAAMPCGITRTFPGPEYPQFKTYHDDWLLSYLPTNAFDVVSVHNYYFPDERVVNGFTFRSYQEHIYNLMTRAGVSKKPVWITEAGYVSRTTQARGRTDESSPEKQAKWIEEAVAQAAQLGVERIFWILLRDRSESYFGVMGLADSRGTPRPAWKKVQELNPVK